jgi:alkanesulfonate monooxygenase SsuD/methylene tetrahydromethanopterin reductase-like flavin-dependent oxidoreductase (luciferase family)
MVSVMKFSIWPNMSHAPAEVLDTARWADATGWHGVWYADHYMPNTGTTDFEPGDTHECWAMLPAIAAVTERVRIGSLVAPTSVHHPAVLANRAATIDHISNGRMVLGLGAGWQINEHAAYGIELEPPGQRVTRFDEAIQIVRSLLADDRTTFAGSVYSITDAPSDPAPIQSPLPILVGTGSPRMLRITARHANEWNTWGDVAMATDRHERFVAACESVDRDPASMWTSVQALVFVTDDEAQAERIRSGPFGSRSIAGSASELVDTIAAYVSIGFDEFIVPDFNLGDAQEARREALERIQSDVIAHL